MIIFNVILFFGILFIFGWQLSRFILNEKRIEALIPLATITGIGVYLFLLNVLSYIIKIQINFYLILILFVIASLLLFFFKKERKLSWGINVKWRKIVFITAILIMIMTGILRVRTLESDELTVRHLPLASSIAEGNFPVKELFAPRLFSQYHYASELFSAAISKITNIPVWFAIDLQTFIFVGVLFLVGFLFVKDFYKKNTQAYLASLLMIYGGGLTVFYAIEGIPGLYRKYILGQAVEAPFRFLNNMTVGKWDIGRAVIITFFNEWQPLSFALLITIVYLYFRAISDEKKWLKITLLNSILFSLLALSGEVFFIPLTLGLAIFPLFFLAIKKNWQRAKNLFKVSILLLLITIPIASIQGGILTQSIRQIISSYENPINYQFSITPQYLAKGEVLLGETTLKIFSRDFILSWGLQLFLIIPATIYLLKRHFKVTLFLIITSLIFFSIPLVVIVGVWQGDFLRLGEVVPLLWNLLLAVFLGELLFTFLKNKCQKLLVIVLILFMVSQGLLFQGFYSIFPNLERGHPLLGEPDSLNQTEEKAIDWIKNNTTIKDYFLTFGEEFLPGRRNSKFILYSGRFAPGFLYGADIESPEQYSNLEAQIPEVVWYQKVLEECDSKALTYLNYRYLYVNENWPLGLEEKCLNQNDLNLNLKFNKAQADEFARIYLIE